jgi:TolB protein
MESKCKMIHFIYKLLGLLMMVSLVTEVHASSRVALVIGNSDYQVKPLANPVNDASDITVKLQQQGFEVEKLIDANVREMKEAIARFGQKLEQQGAVGLFYYAGHGVQVNNRNYLIPLNANIQSEADIEFEAIDTGRVLGQMKQAGNDLNLVILDACRDNPYASQFRSTATRGLARMNAPAGSLILYATSPGDVARDGSNRNGLFTSHLLKAMGQPGLKVEEVFKQTAIGVSRVTGKKQVPWLEGVILGDFYFVEGSDLAKSNLLSFTVKATPYDAKIRILNINPKYHDGIKLKQGSYKVEASKPGYIRQVTDFYLTKGNQVFSVELKRLGKAGVDTVPQTIHIKNDRQQKNNIIPIAVVPFDKTNLSEEVSTDIAGIISHNLNLSGIFKVLDRKENPRSPHYSRDVDYSKWRSVGQKYLVVGRVLGRSSGILDIQFQLLDVYNQKQLIGYSFPAKLTNIRSTSHEISDLIYKKFTGVQGAFNSRIAFIESRANKERKYVLQVADTDGFNPQAVLESDEPLMSPSWSPDGQSLAYVSLENLKPEIFIQNLSTANRYKLRNGVSLSGSLSWSPDGKKLAIVLSKNKNLDVYTISLDTNKLTRLTTNLAVDKKPVWTEDGSSIIFTSDRSGYFQLYEIQVSNGQTRRITFDSHNNSAADVSNDGEIVMLHGDTGLYQLAQLNRDEGELRILSSSNLDNSPSLAPNGQMVAYTTTQGGAHMVPLNGGRKYKVLSQSYVSEIAWGPFKKIRESNTNPSNQEVPLIQQEMAKEAYQKAFEMLKEGRYKMANVSFNEFLDLYPTSAYAGNAQYWLGESNYVQRKFELAVQEFKKLLNNYPHSNKVPDAMLKLGYTYYELGDFDAVRSILNKLRKTHSKSTAARLAGKRLERLKREGH